MTSPTKPNLSTSQKAVVALDALPILEEVAKKRSLLNLKQGAGSFEWEKIPTRKGKETSRSRTAPTSSQLQKTSSLETQAESGFSR